MAEQKLFTIILLSYYSNSKINLVYDQVANLMDEEKIPFEFIIIDDGSKDNSYQIALELEKNQQRVKAYELSRNFTSHYAIFAGLSVCKGACATIIPDDLQTPLETVVKMYRHWEKGEKIVVPFRASRNDGHFRDMFSNLYYRLMNNISDVQFPKGGADGFLIDREVIDILNLRIHPINTSTIVEVLRLGFDPVFIPYDRPSLKTRSRWTFRKRMKLAFDTIFSSSSFPIRLISTIGIFSVFISLLFIVISVLVKLSGNPDFLGFGIPGWTSNLILISFFSGIILFSLGVIAEYIWRIYEEVKNRPGFILKKKKSNSDAE